MEDTQSNILPILPAKMAATPRLCSAIIFICIFYQSTAAIIPDKAPSVTGNSSQEVTTHELDLANLSLPPEVITEALFSQTDLLQDQLEQCEEMIRNNLHRDDTAEIEGLDNDDDDDDEDDEDELNRKIAQLAVNAFSHSSNTDFQVHSNDLVSRKPGKVDGDTTSEDAAVSNKIGEASLEGKEKADNITDEDGEEGKEGEVEYVVYVYDDVDNDEKVDVKKRQKAGDNDVDEEERKHDQNVDDQENVEQESKNKEDVEEKQEDHHQQNSEEQSEEEDEENKEGKAQDPTDNEANTTASNTQSVSDAEETQAQPEEVDISNIIAGDSHNSNDDTTTSEGSSSDAHQHAEHQSKTTQGQSNVHNTRMALTSTPASRSSLSQDSQGHATTKVKPTASKKDKTARPVQDKSKLHPSDKDSEGSRSKRSLSLDQVVLNKVVEGGTQKEVFKVTLGKGRIRRQASPREEVRSWLLSHMDNAEEESPVNIPDITKMAEKFHKLDVLKMAEKSRTADVIKMAGNSLTDDVINMAGKPPTGDDVKRVVEKTATHQVFKMAEKFLQTHKPLLRWSSRHRKSDLIKVQRLLATLRTSPSKAGKVRRRRSLSPGLSPERYVPLIDQLVERLKYLQHSVRVCHMLLPPGHVPSPPSAQP